MSEKKKPKRAQPFDYHKLWLEEMLKRQQLEERFEKLRELLGIERCMGDCCRDD